MRRAVAVVLAILAGLVSAKAQTYPSRPVTLIVPLAAGGVTDIIGRLVADRMKNTLGQPVIVENTTGAGGTLGVTRLYRSQPDGYTLVIGQWTTHVGSASMYSLPFDVIKDFEPVGMLSTGPLWVFGRKEFPAKDAKELIAWLKANPGKATVATIGPGSTAHLCMLYLANAVGSSVQFVPYRGAAPALQDLTAGNIDLSCLEAGQTLPLVANGSLKAYAVLTEKRWFKSPDTPTFDELGVRGLVFPFWHAIWAPKGTPKDVLAKLNAAVVDALADPAVRARLNELGHEIPPRAQQTPEALVAYHQAELDKWGPIIKAANIQAPQ